MPEAKSWVKVNHKMVDTPKVVALTPLYAQGDTEDNSKPVPNINRINDRAAIAAAPATMAPQDTALMWVCMGSEEVSENVCRLSSSSITESLGKVMISFHQVKFGKLLTKLLRQFCTLSHKAVK
jgi:hypothetical protein